MKTEKAQVVSINAGGEIVDIITAPITLAEAKKLLAERPWIRTNRPKCDIRWNGQII